MYHEAESIEFTLLFWLLKENLGWCKYTVVHLDIFTHMQVHVHTHTHTIKPLLAGTDTRHTAQFGKCLSLQLSEKENTV